jgi:hypothetical protein
VSDLAKNIELIKNWKKLNYTKQTETKTETNQTWTIEVHTNVDGALDQVSQSTLAEMSVA